MTTLALPTLSAERRQAAIDEIEASAVIAKLDPAFKHKLRDHALNLANSGELEPDEVVPYAIYVAWVKLGIADVWLADDAPYLVAVDA